MRKLILAMCIATAGCGNAGIANLGGGGSLGESEVNYERAMDVERQLLGERGAEELQAQSQADCWFPANYMQPRADEVYHVLPQYWAADSEHGIAFGSDRVPYLHSPYRWTGCLLDKPSSMLPPGHRVP